MYRLLLASTAVLSLVACTPKPADKAAASAEAATDTANPVPSDTVAGDTGAPSGPITVPKPAAGLWEITTTTTPPIQGMGGAGGPGRGPLKSCVSGEEPVRLGRMGRGPAREGCEPQTSAAPGGGIAFTVSCSLGDSGAHMTTSGTSTYTGGDPVTGYTVRSETEITGAPIPQMNGKRTTEVVGRHLGPCPAGMNPGDIEIAGRIITAAQLEERGGRGMGGGGGAGQ